MAAGAGLGGGGRLPAVELRLPGVRRGPLGRPARARTQSSVAVSADQRRWFLINASPDVRTQIEAFPGLHPHGDRTTPLEAVLLTDAELDHTLGLLLLREARGLRLHATPAVHKTLCDGSGCCARWSATARSSGGRSSPAPTCPSATGCPAGRSTCPPPSGTGSAPGTDHGRVVGYRLTDERSGRDAGVPAGGAGADAGGARGDRRAATAC